jgi:hypothetical protein
MDFENSNIFVGQVFNNLTNENVNNVVGHQSSNTYIRESLQNTYVIKNEGDGDVES